MSNKNGQVLVDGKKFCTQCLKMLPLSRYGKCKNASTGKKSICKKCSAEYARMKGNKGGFLIRSDIPMFNLVSGFLRSKLSLDSYCRVENYCPCGQEKAL